jgi:hypothetical protein
VRRGVTAGGRCFAEMCSSATSASLLFFYYKIIATLPPPTVHRDEGLDSLIFTYIYLYIYKKYILCHNGKVIGSHLTSWAILSHLVSFNVCQTQHDPSVAIRQCINKYVCSIFPVIKWTGLWMVLYSQPRNLSSSSSSSLANSQGLSSSSSSSLANTSRPQQQQ